MKSSSISDARIPIATVEFDEGQPVCVSPATQRTLRRADGPLAAFEQIRSRTTSTEDSPQRQTQAANSIIRSMRSHIARKTNSEMIASGTIWGSLSNILKKAGQLRPDEKLTIDKLSSINLSRLRKKLGTLTESEAGFFDRFTQQQFFVTHFTNAKLDHPSQNKNTVTLLSRKKLESRGVRFNRKNTTDSDIKSKADDGFVFFSLECGTNPAKPKSRFGRTAYRFPFGTPVFRQVAWGALDDMMINGKKKDMPDIERHIVHLNDSEIRAIKSAVGSNRSLDSNDAYSDIFSGKDLLTGAALSLIDKLRNVNDTLRSKRMYSDSKPWQHPMVKRFISSNSSRDFNSLLSIFHRVEIRVPVHYFSDDFNKLTNSELRLIKKWKGRVGNQYLVAGFEEAKLIANLFIEADEKSDQALQKLDFLGIDVRTVSDDQGGSALHLLCKATNKAAYFDDSSDDLSGESSNTSSGSVSDEGISKLISSLLKLGLDVNGRDSQQRTPMFSALHSEPLTQELIRHGADVNATMLGGFTPIFGVREPHIFDLLIQHGADPNHKSDAGFTPLRFCLGELNLSASIFQKLIKAGAVLDKEMRRLIEEKMPLDRRELIPEVGADPESWIQFFAAEACSAASPGDQFKRQPDLLDEATAEQLAGDVFEHAAFAEKVLQSDLPDEAKAELLAGKDPDLKAFALEVIHSNVPATTKANLMANLITLL